jgi:hypothetical protein
MLARKKEKVRMGCREGRNLRHPGHCKWVRQTHACSVPGCLERDICAAHYDGPIPNEDRGGMSEKDHDRWTFPLCDLKHHSQYHNRGWAWFDRHYSINTKAIAEEMARTSPHRIRWQK